MGGMRRAGVLAPTAFHASVQAEELLLAEMVDGADTDAFRSFHFLQGDGRQATQFGFGKEQIQRPGKGVQEAGKRQASDETEHEQGVNPPQGEMRRARAGFTQPGEGVGKHQAHRRTVRRDPGWLLPDHAEALHQVTGDPDGDDCPWPANYRHRHQGEWQC